MPRAVRKPSTSRRRPFVRVTEAFEEDPIGAARRVLYDELRDQCETGPESQSIRGFARGSHAMEMLALATSDAHVLNEAAGEAQRIAATAATLAAGTVADVAAKLALLVRRAAVDAQEEGGGEGLCQFLLAASALADLVIIGDAPLRLPHRACEAILDQDDVDYWRARAEARL